MAKKFMYRFCFLFFSAGALSSCGLVANGIRDSYMLSLDYPLPVADKENTVVIDLTLLEGHAEDYIKLHSFVKSPFSVLIWFHDYKANKWQEYGTGVIKGFGDSATINNMSETKLDAMKYIAIQFMDGETYNIDAYKRKSDVHVNVRD
jgi:hypothetical protein